MHGKEQTIEKPFAVLQKNRPTTSSQPQANQDADSTMVVDDDVVNLDASTASVNRTILDSTVAIEHKTKQQTEYHVRAIIRKKVIFKARPKPIIANVAKTV